jgi:hypothetical protein
MKKDVVMNTSPMAPITAAEQHRVVLHAHQGQRVERGRQAEQADRQQARQQMQVGEPRTRAVMIGPGRRPWRRGAGA